MSAQIPRSEILLPVDVQINRRISFDSQIDLRHLSRCKFGDICYVWYSDQSRCSFSWCPDHLKCFPLPVGARSSFFTSWSIFIIQINWSFFSLLAGWYIPSYFKMESSIDQERKFSSSFWYSISFHLNGSKLSFLTRQVQEVWIGAAVAPQNLPSLFEL